MRLRNAVSPGKVGCVVAMLLLPAGTASAAAADSAGSTASPRHAPVELGVGAQAAVLSGERCDAHGDVVGCVGNGPSSLYAGPHLEARYRFHPAFSIGVGGLWSRDTEAADWWQAEALARWHAVPGPDVDVWLGADAGVVAIAASRRKELRPPATDVRTRPIIGAGGGVSFSLGSAAALGPALRVFVVPFGAIDWRTEGKSYATQTGVELAITATLRFGD